MNAARIALLLAITALAVPLASHAQAPREDVIWARSTAGQTITLDGVLDEPAWAAAETRTINYGVDNGIPGSGYKLEIGSPPTDPTHATLRFLLDGHQLYMGLTVPDSSVGGSEFFNQFDGLLMMIMDHGNLNRPTPVMEHFYSWWYPLAVNPTQPGLLPDFRGSPWANPSGGARDSTKVANWDAVTRVHGLSNSDAAPDTGYTIEMRFNLLADGYDVDKPGGEVVEWSMSIYDCDWNWPIIPAKLTGNRTWWQNPWGNTSWYCEGKIHIRSDVTINSGPVPDVGPDIHLPSAGGAPLPTIDGLLTDDVWKLAPTFDIRFGDDALRETYPGVGPYRSGQFQPPVNGGQAAILDPGDGTIHWFFQGNILYLGFDVRDLVVQYRPEVDRWDGFIVTITERDVRGPDHQLLTRRLGFQVGPDGNVLAADYLPYLRDSLNGAEVALKLKGGTTVDTLGQQADSGYTAELSVDLTKLGYPSGLGDGTLFIGIDMLDGDSFTPFTDSYGTRTWWFREYEGENGPATVYLDPSMQLVVGVNDRPLALPPVRLALRGNYPNPFGSNTTIRYALAEPGKVSLEVFDLQGRHVATRSLGLQAPGERHYVFHRLGLPTGVYLYQVQLADPVTGSTRATQSARMVVVR